jgi:hypothetical protein
MAVYVHLAFGACSRPTVAFLRRVHDLVVPTRAWSDRWSIALKQAKDHRTSKMGIFDESLLWDSRDLPFLSTIFRAIRLEKKSQASSEDVMQRRRLPQWARWIVG